MKNNKLWGIATHTKSIKTPVSINLSETLRIARDYPFPPVRFLATLLLPTLFFPRQLYI